MFSGVGMAPLFFTKNDDGRIQNLMLGGIEAKWSGEKYEFADEGWDILEALSPISHFGNKMNCFDNVNVNLLKKVWNSGDYKIYQGNFVTIVMVRNILLSQQVMNIAMTTLVTFGWLTARNKLSLKVGIQRT